MPPIHFWFTGTAIYLAGSFAFAIVVGLIGIREMIPHRLLYLVFFPAALVLSLLAWWTTAKQERDADDHTRTESQLKSEIGALRDSNTSIEDLLKEQSVSLSNLSEKNSELLGSMSRVASAAKIDPGQSAPELADQIVRKLLNFQNQLAETKDRVKALENPPPDPSILYQANRPVANFMEGGVSKDGKRLEFTEIYNAANINFSRPIEFRGLTLQCSQHGIDVSSGLTPRGLVENIMYHVHCDVISGDVERVKNPPTAPPPSPVPPASPAEK